MHPQGKTHKFTICLVLCTIAFYMNQWWWKKVPYLHSIIHACFFLWFFWAQTWWFGKFNKSVKKQSKAKTYFVECCFKFFHQSLSLQPMKKVYPQNVYRWWEWNWRLKKSLIIFTNLIPLILCFTTLPRYTHLATVKFITVFDTFLLQILSILENKVQQFKNYFIFLCPTQIVGQFISTHFALLWSTHPQGKKKLKNNSLYTHPNSVDTEFFAASASRNYFSDICECWEIHTSVRIG
jgi:hypothetical protein